jgi:UDP-N-acetylmuramate--alanine ligase
MLEVYAAGEESIPGADSRTLCRSIRARGQVDPVYVAHVDDLAQALLGVLHDGDVLITLGAGDIGAASAKLPEQLAKGAQ